MNCYRSYYKSELALLYFPQSSPHTATVRLIGWIRRCDELCRELAKCHNSKYAKFFSPKEVALIFEYLGEPAGIER